VNLQLLCRREIIMMGCINILDGVLCNSSFGVNVVVLCIKTFDERRRRYGGNSRGPLFTSVAL
jgi:hypothetical protein